MTSLSVQDLVKIYPGGVQALKGISFEVQQGEFVAIIGLSGSGKSTLLRCLNRLHQATSGKIIFQQQDVVQLKSTKEVQNLRKKMGMIFQHFNLIPRHTVLSNVLMGRLGSTGTLKSLLGWFSQKDQEEALNYLKMVGLTEKARVRVDQLSGGQQQRVAIARALAQTPQILLADEPVSSLDPSTSHIVMDYLRKINRELGLTIVCNLHSLNLVKEYASKVIALKDGQIVYQGSAKNLNDEWFEKIYGEDFRNDF